MIVCSTRRARSSIRCSRTILAQFHAKIVEDAMWLWVAHDVNPRGMTAQVGGFVQAQNYFIDLTSVFMRCQNPGLHLCEPALHRVNSTLNCFVEVDEQQFLAAADKSDRAIHGGAVVGPLHGVPLAHKDMYYRADVFLPVDPSSEQISLPMSRRRQSLDWTPPGRSRWGVWPWSSSRWGLMATTRTIRGA